MRRRFFIAFLFLALLVASTSLAGPIWMRRSEVSIAVSSEECIARAFRSLRMEGFSPTQKKYESGALTPGEYEARIYGSSGYDKLLERVRFTVGRTPVTPGRMLNVQVHGDRAVLHWSSAPSDSGTWVSIVPAGTADGTHTGKWMYTSGASSGKYEAGPLAPGDYEARIYGSSWYDKLLERVRFTVGRTTPVTPGRMLNVQVHGDRAVLHWSSAPSDSGTWVSVVPAGTADGTHTGKWVYTSGASSGTYEAGPLTPGEYEARIYGSSGYDKLLERVRFTVGPSLPGPPASQGRLLNVQVNPERMAIVRWASAPTAGGSWVSVVPAGTADGTHVGMWVYTNDTESGKYETGTLQPGDYEARFYASSAYDKLIERVRFTVYPRE